MTFEDFDKRINEIANEIPKILEGMQVVCAQEVQVSHKQRLDRGVPKRSYKSKSYKKIRSNAGFQTNFVDMQRTKTLTDNMITGRNGKDVNYGLRNVLYNDSKSKNRPTTIEVYKGQVKNYPELIKVNKDDAKKGIDVSNRFWNDKLKELFN